MRYTTDKVTSRLNSSTSLALLIFLPVLLAGCARLGFAPLPSPCDGIDCDDHGTCEATPIKAPQCVCDEGYLNVGPLHCRQVQPCATDAACDDDESCTDDRCNESGFCVWEPLNESCDDGLFCTLTDRCVSGRCVGADEKCPGQGCDEVGNICFELPDAGVDSGASGVDSNVDSNDGGIDGSNEVMDSNLDHAMRIDTTDSTAPENTILTFLTLCQDPNTFQMFVSKTGEELTWHLGDGSNPVTGNSFTHTYSLVGEKVVHAVSTDGVQGITEIDAGWIDLVGPVPPGLGTITNLTYLGLDFNGLSGSIPAELGNLTNLEYLYLGVNGLSGSIPTELGNMTSLKDVWLGRNQLSGTIPRELGSLTNLTDLALEVNALSGSIPKEIGNLTSLRNLRLYNNQLSGAEPGAIGGLVALRILDLQSNGMSQAAVDAIINEVYQARASFDNGVDKTLNLEGNAVPGAASMAQITELEHANDYRWSISYTKR
ncbi:MAG: hypothetical protein JRH20_16435 [Deltaproteobacteria bacterium]|nr:hypothetical protein [Deltaproteobacteria bacterium]